MVRVGETLFDGTGSIASDREPTERREQAGDGGAARIREFAIVSQLFGKPSTMACRIEDNRNRWQRFVEHRVARGLDSRLVECRSQHGG